MQNLSNVQTHKDKKSSLLYQTYTPAVIILIILAYISDPFLWPQGRSTASQGHLDIQSARLVLHRCLKKAIGQFINSFRTWDISLRSLSLKLRWSRYPDNISNIYSYLITMISLFIHMSIALAMEVLQSCIKSSISYLGIHVLSKYQSLAMAWTL